MQNLILIGMPASGKSTLGVMTAKALGWDFLDTDVFIQSREGRTLKTIIRDEGVEAFGALESNYVCQLHPAHCVVATGGSVVFGARAMAHLQRLGRVVWLKVGLNELQRRIDSLTERGVLHQPGQTLDDILKQREVLYRKYAHTVVECAEKTPQQLVAELVGCVRFEAT